MNIYRILYRIPITWPHPEMPKTGKADYLSVLLGYQNRKAIADAIIIPTEAHFISVRLFAVDRSGMQDHMVIDIENRCKVVLACITDDYCIHSLKIAKAPEKS